MAAVQLALVLSGLRPARAPPLPNKWTLSCRAGPRGSLLHLPSWA